MSSQVLNDLMVRADELDVEEKLLLIAHLAQKARLTQPASNHKRAWSEISGIATSPLVGEDAQTWVSRSRQEDNEY